MCKCECHCDCEHQIDTYMKSMFEQSKREQLERNNRLEYVRRNIPAVLDLVRKYNKLLEKNPETAKDARDLNNLQNGLAEQIINYVK